MLDNLEGEEPRLQMEEDDQIPSSERRRKKKKGGPRGSALSSNSYRGKPSGFQAVP
jgi:hypothetical protein